MTRYLTFTCDEDEFTAWLNKHAANGWSLFGFEPVTTVGAAGSGITHIVAVMIKQEYAEEDTEDEEEPQVGAIGMKG